MKNYTGVKQKSKRPLENLHMEQWHEYYKILSKRKRWKKSEGQKRDRILVRVYNKFILEDFSKNLKLV